MMKEKKYEDKKELLIFFSIAIGVTFIIELILWVLNDPDWASQSEFIGMLPAMGAIVAPKYKYRREKNSSNKIFMMIFIYFFIGLICFSLKLMGILKDVNIANLLNPLLFVASPIAILYAWISCPKLDPSKNIKKGIFPILIFDLVMIIFQILMYGTAFNYPMLFSALIYAIPNFFLVCFSGLGEEYGWRVFLQGKLQRRFGNRMGVIIVGIIVELWHSLFYFCILHGVPQNELPRYIIIRLIHSIGFAVFVGWAYMRTNNIWVCIFIHVSNNSLPFILPTTKYRVSTLHSNVLYIVLSLFLFSFIFTKEFRASPPHVRD